MLIRAHHLSSSPDVFANECNILRSMFLKLKYPPRLIESTISPADKCKIWPNCAFYDKSVKLGTKLEHILRNIFSYRAIADLSRDPSYVRSLSDVIKGGGNLPFVRCVS